MNIECLEISLNRINIYYILNNTFTRNFQVRLTFMRAKWETISIIFIEKMIIDELNFLIEELFVALKEIDNLIIYLWHEGFFPVVHSVFFISFIFFPFSTWIIFINALKTVILRYFYKFFTIKVLAIVAILLYLTS